jgi:pimeloyl-ACP methyl ester carboxylesterase
MRSRVLCLALLAALSLVTSVQAAGLPRKSSLGTALASLSPEQQQQFGVPADQGVLIQQTFPGQSAEAGGLKAGDLILTLDGKPVGLATLIAGIKTVPAGQIAAFTMVRDGKKLTKRIKMLERPRDTGTEAYAVSYDDVATAAGRMRTIHTHPRKPGKHPALFFIQGFSPISYDFRLDGTGMNAPILHAFAADGYVTMRVEKPGVGDSEGGPFNDIDYTTELDIYRQALAQLKAQPDVDTSRIIIFGHSMGGEFGPQVAAESHVAGFIAYGFVGRTWMEYMIDTSRRQALLGGASYGEVDEAMRQTSRAVHFVFYEGMTPDEVKKSHPELSGVVDGTFPDGRFNQKTNVFWSQLFATNFASFWEKAHTKLLSIHGASDFVSEWSDHQTAADIVNRVHPGWAQAMEIAATDHVFNTYATEAESFKNFPNGKFNPAVIEVMKKWAAEVLGG